MENDKNSILNDFIPQLKSFLKSETVFGEPYTVGKVTLIPVNSIKVGFGFGSGEIIKKTDSSGGGGGVIMSPVAFIVIKNDQVTIHNLSTGTIENVMEKAPEFIEKFISLLQKLQNKKKDSNK